MSEPKRPSSSSDALRQIKQRMHPSASEPTPPPRYEMLGELGRGGVGVVYRGRDSDLSREVAMKVLHPEFADNPQVLDRFIEEAQIGGQLQHPGIVPVYEVGLQDDDRPFFAMKLVKGVTLWAQLSRRASLDEDRQRFLAAFAQVCQTMAYAHARRVVHRDLKPENVMIGSFGEVQVVDWGFAKVLPEGGATRATADSTSTTPLPSVVETIRSQNEDGSKSMVGAVLGTPAYMPQEQALGDVERMDLRSDVFGLGGILCEILTGMPPYVGEGHDVLLKAARADLGDARRRLDACGANSALIELCNRCLQAKPEDRPDDAQYVADEVSRYLASVEQRARDAEIKEAEARVRARGTILLSAAALLIVLLGGGGYLYLRQVEAERVAGATQLASDARTTANLALGEARSAGFGDESRWQRAADAAAQAQRLAAAADVRDDERQHIAELADTIAREGRLAAARREQRAKDTAMAREVVAVYASNDIPAEHKSVLDSQVENDRELDELFRDYLGADVDDLSPAEAADRMRTSEIFEALAAALDNWAYTRADLEELTGNPSRSGHLWAIARELDGDDPRRNALRAMLASRTYDGDALRELVAQADWSTMTVAHFQLLDHALTKGHLPYEGATVLRRGVDRFPQSYLLHYRLAMRLSELPDPRFEDAIAAMRAARAIDPNPTCVRAIASYQLQLGAIDEALPTLQALAERHPADSSVWNQLGLAELFRRQFAKAIACFERSMVVGEREPALLCNLGTCYFELGDCERAVAYYRAALDLDERYVSGWSNLSNALRRLDRLDESADAAERAIALDPLHSHAWGSLGATRGEQRRNAEAEPAFRRALELDPDNYAAITGIALLYRASHRTDDALPLFRRAAELRPQDPTVHANLARLLADVGRPQEAVDHLHAQPQRVRESIEGCATIAHIQHALGRHADAEQTLKDGIERFPAPKSLHFALGRLYGDWDRPQESVEQLLLALQFGVDGPEVHSNLAAAYSRLGEIEQSLEHARLAVEAAPAHAPSRFNLAMSLARTGDTDGAVEHLRVARELWSKEATTFGATWYERATLSLVGILQQQGRRGDAIDVLAESARDRPDIASIRSRYATLLLAEGDSWRARSEFEAALRLNPDDAPAWINLATLRNRHGQALLAQAAAHRAEELFATQDTPFGRLWRERSKEFGDELTTAVEGHRQRLPIARGEVEAETAEEHAMAAVSAYALGEYPLAYEAFVRAFARWPELDRHESYGNTAACAAALALAQDGLSPTERSTRRQFALRCLQSDLARLRDLPRETAAQRDAIAGRLRGITLDPDLAAVRDEAAITAMPVEEARTWRALWQDVAARLAAVQQAREVTPR